MSDFKAKMHQIVCRLGLRPRPSWENLQRSPRPLSWIVGAYFKGERGRGERGREGTEGERRVEKGRKGTGRAEMGKGRGRVGSKQKFGPKLFS